MPIEQSEFTPDMAEVTTLGDRLGAAESAIADNQTVIASNGAAITNKEPSHPTLAAIRGLTEAGGLLRNSDGSVIVYAHPTVPKSNPPLMSWAEYSEARQAIATENRALPRSPGGIFQQGYFATAAGGALYYSAILMKNGLVLAIPYLSTVAKVFDPTTSVVSTVQGTARGYIGGVNLPDGRVFLVPHIAEYGAIYDPVSDAVSANAGFVGTSRYRRGALLDESRIFLFPQLATHAAIYDVSANQLTLLTQESFYTNQFAGGCLLPDGRCFLAPYKSSTARIYDPVSDAFSTPSGTYSNNSLLGFLDCKLLMDGRVLIFPYNLPFYGRIYDPVADTLISTSAFAQRSYSNCEMADGDIFVNYITPDARYDPYTDTFSEIMGSLSSAEFIASILLPDGDVFRLPYSGTDYGWRVRIGSRQPISLDLLTSRFVGY